MTNDAVKASNLSYLNLSISITYYISYFFDKFKWSSRLKLATEGPLMKQKTGHTLNLSCRFLKCKKNLHIEIQLYVLNRWSIAILWLAMYSRFIPIYVTLFFHLFVPKIKYISIFGNYATLDISFYTWWEAFIATQTLWHV